MRRCAYHVSFSETYLSFFPLPPPPPLLNSYIAAGLELSPIVESKLLILEEMCRSFNSLGFLTSFQIYRQYALNLRTKRDNPTEFQGEAYYEEQALGEMNPHASKMAIRDSSSLRLQLAFVFWDEEAMAQMLERIKDYPFTDANPPRLHSRLSFTGLAAFALSQRDGCKPYQKLGHDVSCLKFDMCMLLFSRHSLITLSLSVFGTF